MFYVDASEIEVGTVKEYAAMIGAYMQIYPMSIVSIGEGAMHFVSIMCLMGRCLYYTIQPAVSHCFVRMHVYMYAC